MAITRFESEPKLELYSGVPASADDYEELEPISRQLVALLALGHSPEAAAALSKVRLSKLAVRSLFNEINTSLSSNSDHLTITGAHATGWMSETAAGRSPAERISAASILIFKGLQPANQEVAAYICAGYPAKDIAAELDKSANTVDNQLRVVRQQLAVPATELIAAAGYVSKWVGPDTFSPSSNR